MLLDDDPAGVVLQVEQVPHVLGHLCPTDTEVWDGEVTHGLMVLLPLRLLLIVDQKENYQRVGGGGEAVLTQESESNVRHLLDGVVHLAPNDSSLPWFHGVKGYLHPDLTHIQAMGLKRTATIDGYRPIVAELGESAQEL
jgi:hypothetical protein